MSNKWLFVSFYLFITVLSRKTLTIETNAFPRLLTLTGYAADPLLAC